jgi:ATP-dependent Clp protease ATP-binding subunit ClpX
VQQALLKIIEGTRANVTPRGGKKYNQQEYIQVDTSNILFIVGGAFCGIEQAIRRRVGVKGLGFGARIDGKREEASLGELLAQIEPQDLVKFGMIPEFVGRVPIIATLSDLQEDDLVTILTQPKNALTKQYVKLFEMEKVKLSFTREALRACAREAMRRKSGARGLRAILEQAMLDIMYDVPFREGVKECKITEGVILYREPPLLSFEKEKKLA